MMTGVLRATSDFAKANGASSGPDIVLLQEVTHIGRNVPKSAGLPLPMALAQVSGKHCQVIGDAHMGFKVYDTSTNGSYIIRSNQKLERVPKGGSLPIAIGDTLRLSTVSLNNPSAVLEYRLEIAAEATRVRKPDDAAQAEAATPVKRLCMSNVSSTPDGDAEAAKERKLSQLLATNKELQSKLGEARGETEAARNQLDAKVAEAQQLAAELATTRLQGEAAVATAAADAAQHCEQEIKELSAAKASLAQQVAEQQEAVRAQEEATTSLKADLEARQAEVDQLKQQLKDAQQHKDEELQALKISEAGLQERLAAMGAEADDLRDQLRSSAQDLQEMRDCASTAGQKQQQADKEAEKLRQQLGTSQREARDAVTKLGDVEMEVKMLRDELTVNEERVHDLLQQWRKVTVAQRKAQEARAIVQAADLEMEAALGTLGKSAIVNKEKPVAALDQAMSPPADSGAAQFDGTQHTLEVSSHDPAASYNPAAGAAAAGTQAASSAPAPATAAAGKLLEQTHMAAAATAELQDPRTPMQQSSAPDTDMRLDAAKPASENAGDTAATFEPGQKVDTMGRLTGLSAADTQANGGISGSQAAASEDESGDAVKADADAAGDSAPVGELPPATSANPSSGDGKPAAAQAHESADGHGGAAAEDADLEGDPVTNGRDEDEEDEEDEDEDDEMEED